VGALAVETGPAPGHTGVGAPGGGRGVPEGPGGTGYAILSSGRGGGRCIVPVLGYLHKRFHSIPFHSIPFFEFFPVPLPIPSCAQAAKSTVASTYAMALADTCTDANMKRDTQELEAVHTDMETLSAYIAGNELVAAFLSDPLQEARAAQLS